MPKRLIKPAGRFISDRSVLLGIWMALLMTPIWFAFLATPPVEYGYLPLPVVSEDCFDPNCPQPPVHPGDTLVVRVERVNHTKSDVTYPITRQLRDVDTGDTQLLNPVSTTVPPGYSVGMSRLHVLPPALPPGRYILYGTATIPGTWRNHILNWQTEPFEVTPRS